MAISTVSISVNKAAEAGGLSEATSAQTFTNNTAPDNRTVQSFASTTFAAVTVPTGATGVYIIPPSTNTGAITLKGVTGDTGVTLHKTQATWLSLDTSAAFGLLCASATVVEFEWT